MKCFISAIMLYVKWNTETFQQQAESICNTACLKQLKSFHGCFSIFVLAFYFKCVKAEIKQ